MVRPALYWGSAVKHPHPLVTGYYSVHTHRDALVKGEAEIDRLGAKYRAEGIIPLAQVFGSVTPRWP